MWPHLGGGAGSASRRPADRREKRRPPHGTDALFTCVELREIDFAVLNSIKENYGSSAPRDSRC